MTTAMSLEQYYIQKSIKYHTFVLDAFPCINLCTFSSPMQRVMEVIVITLSLLSISVVISISYLNYLLWNYWTNWIGTKLYKVMFGRPFTEILMWSRERHGCLGLYSWFCNDWLKLQKSHSVKLLDQLELNFACGVLYKKSLFCLDPTKPWPP